MAAKDRKARKRKRRFWLLTFNVSFCGRPDQAKRRSGRCLAIAGTALRLVLQTQPNFFILTTYYIDFLSGSAGFSSSFFSSVDSGSVSSFFGLGWTLNGRPVR